MASVLSANFIIGLLGLWRRLLLHLLTTSLHIPLRQSRTAILLALIAGLIIRDVECLKMLGVDGPRSVNKGEVITLTCRYDLERDALYSMKWFKDDHEIHRYIPTDAPEFKAFDAPGIRIDSKSTLPTNLVAKVLSPLASGSYMCEITVETPSFVTRAASHNLTVVVPPRLGPSIVGIDTFYYPGDIVEVECVSKDSNPAPNLKWKFNGGPVPKGFMLPFNKTLNLSTGLESAQRMLRFTARDSHFPNGELRLKCTAEIEGVWNATIDRVARGGSADRGSSGGGMMYGGGGGGDGPNRLLVRGSASKIRDSLHWTLQALFVLVATCWKSTETIYHS